MNRQRAYSRKAGIPDLRQPDVEAQLGRKLALGVHKSAGFAVRKNVEIKSVQVFDPDV